MFAMIKESNEDLWKSNKALSETIKHEWELHEEQKVIWSFEMQNIRKDLA